MDTRSIIVMWETPHNNADLNCFKTLNFAGTGGSLSQSQNLKKKKLLRVFGSFGQQEGVPRRHRLHEEVVRVPPSFPVDEVGRTPPSSSSGLFDSGCELRSSTLLQHAFMASAGTTLALHSLSLAVDFSHAPHQLQPYSSSYQDSTQVQSRQHFRESGNVVDASEGSSCAGESGHSSLEWC